MGKKNKLRITKHEKERGFRNANKRRGNNRRKSKLRKKGWKKFEMPAMIPFSREEVKEVEDEYKRGRGDMWNGDFRPPYIISLGPDPNNNMAYVFGGLVATVAITAFDVVVTRGAGRARRGFLPAFSYTRL